MQRPGNSRRRDKGVVLQKPNKYAGKHPRDGNLRDQVRPPFLKRDPDPVGSAGLLVFLRQVGIDLGDFIAAGAEIGLHLSQERVQVGQ